MMEFDLSLIDLVKEFPLIYDKRELLFKDKASRKGAWKDIGMKLGSSAEECEQRWSVLRNRYNTELRRERRGNKKDSLSDHALTTRRTWPYADKMKFLDVYIKPRTIYNRYGKPLRYIEDEQLKDHNYEEPHVLVKEEPEIEIFEDEPITPITIENDEWEGIENITSALKQDEEKTSENLVQEQCNDNNEKTEKKKRKMNDEKTTKQKSDIESDVNEAFGHTVALMLKSIRNNKRRRKARVKILAAFSEFRSDSEDSN